MYICTHIAEPQCQALGTKFMIFGTSVCLFSDGRRVHVVSPLAFSQPGLGMVHGQDPTPKSSSHHLLPDTGPDLGAILYVYFGVSEVFH